MFAGVKIIPREELLKHEEENNLTAPKRRKDKHRQSFNEDNSLERKERRAKRSRKKTSNGTPSCSDVDGDSDGRDKRSKGQKRRSQREKDGGKKRDESDKNDMPEHNNGSLRKEMGLEWMLKPGNIMPDKPTSEGSDQESQGEQVKKINKKELNPYLQDNGSGYPDDDPNMPNSSQLLSSSLVGDGGASWRLKALKRAKEHAAREGRTLQEVVGERWGSLQELAASVAIDRGAPGHAHLSAINKRKKGKADIIENQDKRSEGPDDLQDVYSQHPGMKKPKRDIFQWRSSRSQTISSKDNSLISEALSGINKFANDGSFMDSITNQQSKDVGVLDHSSTGTKEAKNLHENYLVSDSNDFEESLSGLSSNQLAAKVLQLRIRGKHEEAEYLSKQMDLLQVNKNGQPKAVSWESGASAGRFIEKQLSSEKKKREDDADKHLAQQILQNRSFSMSGSIDDEYDFDGAPRKKHKKKDVLQDKVAIPKRLLTQKERCQFCFENPSRPKHLAISIANFTYMMVPPWEPVVQGHCCILPLQHESSTRTIDRNVWEEIRNFKKCLLKMFSMKEKDVIFLETVVELSRQRRHCLIECIPIPSQIAKQAPLYFKKAIDEAEDEWGQHDMKKVIQTSGNLRNVIPENLSYFHVEFGLDRGFVHVIDDDDNFPSSFGPNVIRGMLRLPEEDMHRHRKREPTERQKQAVAAFVQEWEPFDWTKDLD